MRELLKT